MIIMMVGLQGSGKSTRALEICAARNADNEHTIILSSDHIRKSHPEWTNEQVFSNLYMTLESNVKLGTSVIIDATNTTVKSRKKLFRFLEQRKLSTEVVACVLTTPYEICVERVKARNEAGTEHQVPLEVLQRYLHSFEIPFLEEGFSKIILDNCPEVISCNPAKRAAVLEQMFEFDQQNLHHCHSLGTHCAYTHTYLHQDTGDYILAVAGALHDYGKLFTQTFKPGDPNAHYYDHANVGTYKLLSNLDILGTKMSITMADAIEVLFFINYHMKPHYWESEKSIRRAKETFGVDKFNKLLIFNKADKARV